MDKLLNNLGLLFAFGIGSIALGMSILSLGTSLENDIDFFKFANNVTDMSSEIQNNIKSKEFSADLFTITGLIAVFGGILMLIPAYILWKKINLKK